MKIYVNGSIVEEDKAVISVYDHGFLYGIGLFETFRSYKGIPFLLEEHRKRLADGCRQLGIAYDPYRGGWEPIIESLLAANGLEDAYIRFTVTAGQDLLGLPSSDYEKPSVVVYIKSLPPGPVVGIGKALQQLELPRNTPEGAIRFKSLHYMNNVLAKRELMRYPWANGAEGLLADADGHIAEGITSNVFFVKAGKLYTPSIATGILPGITRALIGTLAIEADIQFEEGLYGWDDMLAADEVFMTNSIQEIVPITKLFGRDGIETPVSFGVVGAVTCLLQQMYQQRIQVLSKTMRDE
ncbi:aminodeoxychorismate lyase [Paenibacillus agricola]|uniref:Aminodeoxychorismate lyase n=1 Tax=Paenibacillus agricola TaxID=2716264 RepID=A0ABX0JLG3_9BACL|nr:aminodeoxychorismate lyase [Paenibacillus agricola]NHN35051.1 aminodeoxychorismate lyase [Paenibacillus agricola]